MDERDYWTRLEYRICAEFRGFADKQLRWYWCDGLIAEEYDLGSEEPCVRGRAWCGPSGQESWQFRLLVAAGTRSRDDIHWSTLLPDDASTGWLSPDPRRKTMTIDPLHGHPD